MGWLIKTEEEKRERALEKAKSKEAAHEAKRKRYIEELEKKAVVFNGKKIVVGVDASDVACGNEAYFFDDHRALLVTKSSSSLVFVPGSYTPYSYDDITGFEMYEDGKSIMQKGGTGRAIAGGMIFGGAGAIVGASTSKRTTESVCDTLQVVITTKGASLVKIDFLHFGDNKKSGSAYQMALDNARRCVAKLEEICSNHEHSTGSVSNADEIRKYKELCDDGIISQGEFDSKKRELLGL